MTVPFDDPPDADTAARLAIARHAALRSREPDQALTGAPSDRARALQILRLLPMYRRWIDIAVADAIGIACITGYYLYHYKVLPAQAIAWVGFSVLVLAWQLVLRRATLTPKGRYALLAKAPQATFQWQAAYLASAGMWCWCFFWVVSEMAPAHDAAFLLVSVALVAGKVIIQRPQPAMAIAYVTISLVVPATITYALDDRLRDTLTLGTLAAAIFLAGSGVSLARRRDSLLLHEMQQEKLTSQLREHTADVQERLTRAETALQHLQGKDRHRKDFLDHLSHDLSQPLTAIGISTRHAEAALRERDVAGVLDALDNINTTQRSTMSVLQNLLRLSRFESGQQKFVPVWFDPGELLKELDASFRQQALDKNGLDFRLRCSRRVNQIFADRAMLRQLLSNLIHNAIKYTEEGSVLVTIRRRRDSAQIRVWDTGPGFPQDQLHRIFEPFWRADGAASLLTGGTGIGLTIARRIAQGMGANLRLLELPRHGSVFEINLALRIHRDPESTQNEKPALEEPVSASAVSQGHPL